MKCKMIRHICVGTSSIKFDQNQSNHLREIVGVRLNWWRGAMLQPTCRQSTGGPPYPRVIRSKTYRCCVKPRIIPNTIHRVSQEEWKKLRESVPYVELYRYNSKHLYPELNGYGDNGQRKVWASGVSTYCTPSVTPYSSSAHARQRDTAS